MGTLPTYGEKVRKMYPQVHKQGQCGHCSYRRRDGPAGALQGAAGGAAVPSMAKQDVYLSDRSQTLEISSLALVLVNELHLHTGKP